METCGLQPIIYLIPENKLLIHASSHLTVKMTAKWAGSIYPTARFYLVEIQHPGELQMSTRRERFVLISVSSSFHDIHSSNYVFIDSAMCEEIA